MARLFAKKTATVGIVVGDYIGTVDSVKVVKGAKDGRDFWYFAVEFTVEHVEGQTKANRLYQNVFPTYSRKVEVSEGVWEEQPVYNLVGHLLELAREHNPSIPEEIDDEPENLARLIQDWLCDIKFKLRVFPHLDEQSQSTPYWDCHALEVVK